MAKKNKSSATMKSWYAVYTKPRSEEVASENLHRQGFETYFPRCVVGRRRRGRWLDIVEPLFPRYLFVCLDLEKDNSSSIRSTRGAVGLVKFSGSPAAASKGFVEKLIASADKETGLHPLNLGDISRGDKVQVVDGPLSNAEAVFWSYKGSDRALLLLSLLGKQNLVSVNKNKVIRAA